MSAFSVGACAARSSERLLQRDLRAHRHGAEPRLKIRDFAAGLGIFARFAELREQRQHLPNIVFGYGVAPLSTCTTNARHAKLGAPAGGRRMQKR